MTRCIIKPLYNFSENIGTNIWLVCIIRNKVVKRIVNCLKTLVRGQIETLKRSVMTVFWGNVLAKHNGLPIGCHCRVFFGVRSVE